MDPVLDVCVREPIMDPRLDDCVREPIMDPRLDDGVREPIMVPRLDDGVREPIMRGRGVKNNTQIYSNRMQSASNKSSKTNLRSRAQIMNLRTYTQT